MKESIFTTEILGSLRDLGAWAYKIADAPITKRVLDVTRFTQAKPCDIFACIDGTMIAIETKQIKKWRAFSLADMRPAQIVQLSRIAEHGGRSFVFLNVRIPRKENRLLVFEWTALFERLQISSIKGLELERLSYYEAHKTEDGKVRFDLQPWADDFFLTAIPAL